jgi:hypothetical protein
MCSVEEVRGLGVSVAGSLRHGGRQQPAKASVEPEGCVLSCPAKQSQKRKTSCQQGGARERSDGARSSQAAARRSQRVRVEAASSRAARGDAAKEGTIGVMASVWVSLCCLSSLFQLGRTMQMKKV